MRDLEINGYRMLSAEEMARLPGGSDVFGAPGLWSLNPGQWNEKRKGLGVFFTGMGARAYEAMGILHPNLGGTEPIFWQEL